MRKNSSWKQGESLPKWPRRTHSSSWRQDEKVNGSSWMDRPSRQEPSHLVGRVRRRAAARAPAVWPNHVHLHTVTTAAPSSQPLARAAAARLHPHRPRPVVDALQLLLHADKPLVAASPSPSRPTTTQSPRPLIYPPARLSPPHEIDRGEASHRAAAHHTFPNWARCREKSQPASLQWRLWALAAPWRPWRRPRLRRPRRAGAGRGGPCWLRRRPPPGAARRRPRRRRASSTSSWAPSSRRTSSSRRTPSSTRSTARRPPPPPRAPSRGAAPPAARNLPPPATTAAAVAGSWAASSPRRAETYACVIFWNSKLDFTLGKKLVAYISPITQVNFWCDDVVIYLMLHTAFLIRFYSAEFIEIVINYLPDHVWSLSDPAGRSK